MFWNIIYSVFVVTSPVLTSVATNSLHVCGTGEFQCSDGACISLDQVCNGKTDCFDNSDEGVCRGVSSNFNPLGELILQRSKRQTNCRRSQWQCRDGSCIGLDGKCDGVVNCPDGSDETFPLCRKTPCQSNWFRCTYGACVDGTAPCNGIKECADDSDELLPRCRNETEEVRGQFRCANGQLIPAADHCDGTVNCGDGSDETVRSCAGNKCPGYLFQCAYGACVDGGADCDGVKQCADGSDESDELCNRISSVTTTTQRSIGPGNCVVPPHPANGVYSVMGEPSAKPGQSFKFLNLNVTCNWGYRVKEKSSVLCFNGSWGDELPQCVQFCRLNPHESVEYRCVLSGDQEGTRPCGPREPAGTVVRPECRRPNYYYPGVLPLMRCVDGNWDSIAVCQPGLVKNGTKITVVIKDSVEVYISDFQYSDPNGNANTNNPVQNGNANTNNTVQIGNANTNNEIQNGQLFMNGQVTPITNQVSSTTDKNPIRDTDYDIDYGDWRIGSKKKHGNVHIYFGSNNTVHVNAPESNIVFKDT